MDNYQRFANLHQDAAPLLLANCWDVHSAKMLEIAGYPAVGFSSHALSTALGYEDGERLPFHLLVHMTKRVVSTLNVPFTVDMEGGFSRNIDQVLANIDELIDAGAAGINLEDTIAGATRELQKATHFGRIVTAIVDHLGRMDKKLFLNIRTDGFLLNRPDALSETLSRIKVYENAGADGIFVPCITNRQDIEQVVNATALPINVMAMPGLPDWESLQRLGVRRISMGPFLFNKTYERTAALAENVWQKKDLSPLF
ncbi:MAG TPA: isocitrate lyase/phosphoenolpyruvate mutase family protein [Puia sp.]|jgi:2-methylisocitrate lyase-like PEP mutase family enzyme|nr:isocitrate lyase/phosphoenolpyruvate mutase family protein [Puia sp.]